MSPHRRHFHGRWVILMLAAAFGLAACTAFKPKLAPPSTRELPPRKVELPEVFYLGVPCYIHEVRWPEESLATIALWYTGSRRNAGILARVTPNLRSGDFLRQGDKVFVPQELARRATPMPRGYARSHAPSPSAGDARTGDAASGTDDATPPSPYGPRSFPD